MVVVDVECRASDEQGSKVKGGGYAVGVDDGVVLEKKQGDGQGGDEWCVGRVASLSTVDCYKETTARRGMTEQRKSELEKSRRGKRTRTRTRTRTMNGNNETPTEHTTLRPKADSLYG